MRYVAAELSSKGLLTVEGQQSPTRKIKVKVKRTSKRQSTDEFEQMDLNNKKIIMAQNPIVKNVISMTQISDNCEADQWKNNANTFAEHLNPIRVVDLATIQISDEKRVDIIDKIVKDKVPAIKTKTKSKTSDVAEKLLSLIETELGGVMSRSKQGNNNMNNFDRKNSLTI